MNIKEYMQNNLLFLDGAMGTLLYSEGQCFDVPSEEFNIIAPQVVTEIHKTYYDAGCNVVSANTFGVNAMKYSECKMRELISAAFNNSCTAKNNSVGVQKKFIAFDIGPLGKLLKPYGNIDFNDAVEYFARAVRIASEFAFDLILIETMNDSYETKAALLAAKENSSLPVFVTNAYGLDEKLVTGASPEVMACMLEGLGADAIGANCSFGPDKTLPVIKRLLNYTSLPVIMKPNAGLPIFENGKSFYNMTAADFALSINAAVDNGVSIVGGCCGTTPEMLKATIDSLKEKKIHSRKAVKRSVVSSWAKTVELDSVPKLIGERINPTGKKRFKQALIDNDIDYILSEGLGQQDKGVHILDVNVGLAGIDEKALLPETVSALQAVCDLPLQLDSADTEALEKAMRIYNGKPLINSVNGKADSMKSIFPLVRKYGGCVVALTLDENGIPETADERIEIAKNILSVAASYGIERESIIFDPLTMTVSTDIKNASVTLECVRRISQELGCRTVLGVSNVSFGLPQRDKINSAFFVQALSCGLSAAIMNPYSDKMLDAYFSFCALNCLDSAFERYIAYCESDENTAVNEIKSLNKEEELIDVIFRGRKERAAELTSELLSKYEPMHIISAFIIPALDKTGACFEKGSLFLPQLLVSADAASAAFEIIKSSSEGMKANKFRVILATVEGDIHDIGKNIVRLLLENYGFEVIDLGKDVKPQVILDSIVKYNVPIVGLSALMTTTLEAMKNTVRMIKEKRPDCRVFVGGAVVTEEFAQSINADRYTKDAMESVRYADEVFYIMLNN